MTKKYVTSKGDMWDSIAYKELGSERYTDELMNLNQKYREYYIFPAGIELLLPEPSEVSTANLPPWRRVQG